MILKFDFDLDVNHLLEIWSKIKNKQINYKDDRFDKASSHWKIVRHDFEYAKELSKIFNVESRPRFYILDANTILNQHTDFGTLCSLNFILSDNPAPIIFGDTELTYKYALLDTTELHGVVNNDEDRLLFKMSIFNESFDDVNKKLLKNSNIKKI
jgi:hypothetical protein